MLDLDSIRTGWQHGGPVFPPISVARHDILALIAEIEQLRAKDTDTLGESNATPLTIEDVQGKTQLGILKFIAKRNGGVLYSTQAIKLMKDADIFGNPDHADTNVYCLLNRVRDFTKVSRGVYRLVEKNYERSRRQYSGIRKVVRVLRTNNPSVTKAEILKYLVATKFDFKGRDPVRAVNLAWLANCPAAARGEE